ncbi:MAG: glycosyltransferase family 2 protein [archaeon YNP-WB-062]|jgi:glycosyltransferase involved in cell wall biosynthesis|nr:glycosyltransferase family 2 protein [Candidatus Culexarchaeum yellowstonense]
MPDNPGHQVDVSVIIPTLNEQETIGVCIQKVRQVFERYGIRGEIIVSDSSTDRTPEIARALGAIVVRPDRRGYGYAYRFAFKYARGRYIVIGDGDDTYDFLEMYRLLEPLMRREADLVIGSRFRGRIEKGAMPWLHRWIGNPVLTSFLNIFFKAGVSDAHSGFRAIRRDALERLDLRADGMEFASEMIVEACRKGLRIKEVPINYYRRKKNESKLRSFHDGWKHMKFMLLNAPNWLFTYPGAAIFLAGLVLTLSALFRINIGYLPGIHSMIAGSLLIILGYQILFFGAFSKVLGHGDLPKFLTLEKGAAAGTIIFMAGLIWAIKLLLNWISSGFRILPPVEHDVACFTLVVIGLQTYFSSFMLSVIAEQRKRMIATV